MKKAHTSLCLFRVKPSHETEFASLLKTHWTTLRDLDLVVAQPPQTFRGLEKEGAPLYVELLTWKNADACAMAHELPEVLAIWEPMDLCCEARDGKPPMEFPDVEPLALHD